MGKVNLDLTQPLGLEEQTAGGPAAASPQSRTGEGKPHRSARIQGRFPTLAFSGSVYKFHINLVSFAR